MKWKTTRVSFDHITRLSSEKSTSRRPRGPLPLWSEEGFFYAALTLLLPPSPRYFTMLANYRHCIPSHLFSPSLLATTRPPFSLSFSRPFALYLDLPPYGWGVMHERGTLADGERRGGNQSEEGLWNNNEVSVSRSSASVMHGIYVKGNSSKRYKRGIRT